MRRKASCNIMLIDVDQSHRVSFCSIHQFSREFRCILKCCTIFLEKLRTTCENCRRTKTMTSMMIQTRLQAPTKLQNAWNVSRDFHIWHVYLLHCYFKLELLTQPRNWVLLFFFFMVMMFTHLRARSKIENLFGLGNLTLV